MKDPMNNGPMNDRSCSQFLEELALHAAESGDLGASASAHLENCPACRGKVAALKSAALLHRFASVGLPEPRRRLTRARLDRALDSPKASTYVPISIRPLLACAALLLIALIIAFKIRSRTEPVTPPIHAQNATPAPETKAVENLAPTMQLLRDEAARERLFATAPSGSRLRHYRLNDVVTELEN